jgi:hypothetical protein
VQSISRIKLSLIDHLKKIFTNFVIKKRQNFGFLKFFQNLIFRSIHTPRFTESGKHFQAPETRAIDSPHKFTPRKSFSGRKSKNCRFSFQYTHPDYLNQDQGSVFKLWKRAQSIPRIKLALMGSFKKNFGPKKT